MFFWFLIFSTYYNNCSCEDFTPFQPDLSQTSENLSKKHDFSNFQEKNNGQNDFSRRWDQLRKKERKILNKICRKWKNPYGSMNLAQKTSISEIFRIMRAGARRFVNNWISKFFSWRKRNLEIQLFPKLRYSSLWLSIAKGCHEVLEKKTLL